ncbi:recombinase family protein [uncultured Anaerotruncus sp.]|uniref:recombinase family protein n=1 Tax=uncultured Anaerotruncus sp. TaxID=905011 RepID=UPI00280C2A0C|nr:recombinase family protein [uncultured Anaerotruncus sp.]
MTCAIYCRLSREDAEKVQESESIQNQKAMLAAYAASQGWEVGAVYCDEDYSGADRDRPGWNAMLAAAERREFQIVLCKTQSRFTRDMELVEKYLHGLFPLWGIRFVAVVDHVDTDLKGGKKARQINGLINEWYLEDLSENIRAVFAQKRGAGKYLGSIPAYGYRKDPADHNHLVIEPEAAGAVRTIFSLCLEGFGKQKIAALLNERGIPSPAAYRRARGWIRNETGGGLWNRTTVGRILRSELYVGTMVQGVKHRVSYKSKTCAAVPKEAWCRVEGTHEAIVDRASFDAVQALLDRRTRSGGTGEPHPLAGIARCAGCGGPLVKVSQLYKGKRRSYLQCGLYASSRSCPRCTRHSVRLDALTGVVEERIRMLVRARYRLSHPERLLPPGEAEGSLRRERAEAQDLRNQIARRMDALRALYLDRVDGLIGREEFSGMSARFREERQALEARLDALEARMREAPPEPPGRLAERAEALLRLEPMPRELIALLVDSVSVGERQPDGTQEVSIRWRL